MLCRRCDCHNLRCTAWLKPTGNGTNDVAIRQQNHVALPFGIIEFRFLGRAGNYHERAAASLT